MSSFSSASPIDQMVSTRSLQSLREGIKPGAGGGFWHMGPERASGKRVSRIDSIVKIALWRFVGRHIV